MPKLPRLSGHDAAAILQRFGFVPGRIKGSHMVLKRTEEAGTVVCVVPLPDELATGTLRSVLRQAGISPDDFVSALRHS